MKRFSGDAIFRKSQLAACIGEMVSRNGWSQREAARQLGISQAKLSNMFNGKFEGVSELKLMQCLVLMGNDVKIIVSRAPQGSQGELSVEIL